MLTVQGTASSQGAVPSLQSDGGMWMASLTLGPLVFPAELAVLVAAVVMASVSARLLRNRMQADVEPMIWRVLLLSLIAARLGFVLEFAAVYMDAPLQVLNLRDGGWSAPAGWGTAWAYTIVLGTRRPSHRRAMYATMAMASIVALAGQLVLLRLAPQEQHMPALALVTLDAREQSLADFAGRPVVLNLWATWCPPCQREMPALQRAQQQYPGVHFVFANQGESREKVQRFLALKGLALDNVLLDAKGELARHFEQRGLPTTFFFDANGVLVDARTGELSEATIAQRLARWPGAATPASPRPAALP